MEEELLRQILQELQDQSGTSWLDFLQLMIPALVGLIAGLAGAAVGIYSVRRSSASQLESLRLTTEAELRKISAERRLEWRRERYLELVNSLAEFIAALDRMLDAQRRYCIAVFHDDTANEDAYLETYNTCVGDFEKVRSSGRLSEGRLKIGDETIGNQVNTLASEADSRYLAMIRFAAIATTEFVDSGKPAGSDTRFWPEEHAAQRADIAKRTHQISEQIEARISAS